MSYNPNPTRVWSRVQNPCTFTVDSSYNSVFIPLTDKTGSQFAANYQTQLLTKGNILQYKKNSSSLTKNQRYAQICKGMWTNRTKSYATQTQTYTNPNTSNLLQVNYASVPTNGNTNNIPGPYNFNIPAPYGCISDTIKDGGSLLCNTIVNPCTDEIVETTTVLQCYPTYCSDVPGPIQDLCWNPKLQTWYPRQRYTMPTSGTKWPEGYKGFVSAVNPEICKTSIISNRNNISVNSVSSVSSNIDNSVSSNIDNSVSSNIDNSVSSNIDNSVSSNSVNSVSSNIDNSVNSVNSSSSNSVSSNSVNSVSSSNNNSVSSSSNNNSNNNSSAYYVIENTNNDDNSINLSKYLTYNNTIVTIDNKTKANLTIHSPIYLIADNLYYPNGTNNLDISPNYAITIYYFINSAPTNLNTLKSVIF